MELKKLFTFIILSVFLVSTISALEFDNTISYSENDLKVTFENAFGLPLFGSVLGEAKLRSHNSVTEIKNVRIGSDVLVMYYDLYNWNFYENGLGKVEFTDVRTGSILEKDYYLAKAIYQDRQIYKWVEECSEEILGNGSIKKDCVKHLEEDYILHEIVSWERLENNNIPEGNTTIGLFTDVKKGDYIDGKFTIVGKKVSKHAAWTPGLNTDIHNYYKLNESSGAVIDSVGNNAGTNNGATPESSGKIGTAYQFVAAQSDFIQIDSAPNLNTPATFNAWLYTNSVTANRVIYGCTANGYEWLLDPNGNVILGKSGASQPATSTQGVELNKWTMVTTLYNGTNVIYYINGTFSNMVAYSSVISDIGCEIGRYDTYETFPFDGIIDELSIWDRELTSDEITSLWNNGDGITYTDTFDNPPSFIIEYPQNGLNTSNNNININFTAFDINLNSVWWSNNSGTYNYSLTLGSNITGQTWPEGLNTIQIYANDSLDQRNSSTISFYVDSIKPYFIIDYPTNATSYINNNININFTAFDINLNSVWWSNNSGTYNYSLTLGSNITGQTWPEGLNTIQIYANDSLLNSNSTAISFNIDTVYPVVTITEPPKGQNYTYTTTEINYTITVDTPQACWWTKDSGLTNNSLEPCGTNITGQVWEQGQTNVTIYANDSYGLQGSDTVSFTVDSISPSLNITYPFGNITYFLKNSNLSLNWTVSDTNLQSCYFTYDNSNFSTSCLDLNSSFQVTDYKKNNLTFFVNDSFGNMNSTFVSWGYLVFEINQSFNNITTLGNLENFRANVYINPGLSISSANFSYNGTSKGGQSFDLGDNYLLRKLDLLIPTVPINSNVSFYWELSFSNGPQVNLTAYNQTVISLQIDNCSTNTNRILNFTVVDEELQTFITNATIETAVNIYSSNRANLVLNVSDIYNNPTGICLNVNLSNNSAYSLDTIVRYYGGDYAIEYYNIVNYSLNSNSTLQNIILYDLNLSDSQDFQLTFVGSEFVPVEDALVFVDRQYISENIFKTVELPKTDSNGQTVVHLVRNNILYNLRIIKGGIVLGTFNNIIAFCDDYTIDDCTINLDAFDSTEEIFDYNEDLGITFTPPSFSNITRLVSFNFLTDDGSAKEVSMSVERSDIFGNRSICNDTLTSSGGTLSCSVPANVDESTLKVSVFVDGVKAVSDNIKLESTNFGEGGYLIFFVMALSFIIMLASSKTGVLVGMGLSIVTGVGLGLTSSSVIGTGASVIYLIVIIVIGIWKLNKGKPS